MKTFFYCFILLCAVSLLPSCKSGTSPSASNTSIQDIFPLKVGNSWVYAVTEYSSDGTVKGTFPDTIRIVGSTTSQGAPAFEYTQQGADTLLFYYSGSSDLYSVQRGNASIALHYPMNIGDTYVLSDSIYPSGFEDKYVLILQSNNESVTVPAGSFSSVHYDQLEIEGTSGI
jgi:hypothetical protein